MAILHICTDRPLFCHLDIVASRLAASFLFCAFPLVNDRQAWPGPGPAGARRRQSAHTLTHKGETSGHPRSHTSRSSPPAPGPQIAHPTKPPTASRRYPASSPSLPSTHSQSSILPSTPAKVAIATAQTKSQITAPIPQSARLSSIVSFSLAYS